MEKNLIFKFPKTLKLIPISLNTGDVFASTLVGTIANGLTWKEAIPIAADYTVKCIQLTLDDKNGRSYGVNFEEGIPYLLKRMGKCLS